MTKTQGAVRALILAGGSGTRLWPRSTDAVPKPFLPLTSEKSLLAETVARAAAVAGEDGVLVSARGSHAPLIEAACPGLPRERVILEPERRDTAPAIALAALAVARKEPDATLAVLPSDQAVKDVGAFVSGLSTAVEVAASLDGFVTLGIRPTRPETGFGYLETDPAEAGLPVRRVVRFAEKPPLADAQRYAASEAFFWNAGIFVFRVPVLLSAMEAFCPDILEAVRQAESAREAGDAVEFAAAFGRARKQSIDYAVMEKAARVVVVPCDCGWSDVGSWDAVHDFREPDASGNVVEGPVECRDVADSLVLAAEGRPVTVIGLTGVIVVDSPEGLLVTRRGASDRLRDAVEARMRKGRAS